MGERARALEALIVAMGDNVQVRLDECSEELQAWAAHWWRKLEPPLKQEEAAPQIRREVEANTVEDSLESVEGGQGHQDSIQALGREGTFDLESMEEPNVANAELNQMLREEREIEEEMQNEEGRDQQLEEYEADLKLPEEEDIRRWEELQATRAAEGAQRWDDWAVASELGTASAASSTGIRSWKLKVVLQGHDREGRVRERREMSLDLASMGTVTMGFQLLGSEQQMHGSRRAAETAMIEGKNMERMQLLIMEKEVQQG